MGRPRGESKERFGYRMPVDVRDFVDQVAGSLDISRNSALTLIVRQYLVEHPEHPEAMYFRAGKRPEVLLPVPFAEDVISWNSDSDH